MKGKHAQENAGSLFTTSLLEFFFSSENSKTEKSFLLSACVIPGPIAGTDDAEFSGLFCLSAAAASQNSAMTKIAFRDFGTGFSQVELRC